VHAGRAEGRDGKMLNASRREILGEVRTVKIWIAVEEGPR
jgi:hypothetical protein